jgi:deoxyribodipyrimidine photolyase-related protein
MGNVVLVLGDQLTLESAALRDFDIAADRVLMIEAAGEAVHVWSHKARIVLFLSAMRHFAQALRSVGHDVLYHRLGDDGPAALGDILAGHLRSLRPSKLVVCEPGDWRVQQAIVAACSEAGCDLEWRPDNHFLCSKQSFADWARGRKELRMEYFYREMRRRQGVLMQGGEPEGGRWNFDTENRRGFGKSWPGAVPAAPFFAADAVVREVISVVELHFGGHPGHLESFGWPVTRQQALSALDDFIRVRLADFGRHQDAMWTGTPYAWHSLLSSSLNLKLLDPREAVAAAERAYREGKAPLASAEGFIRQILGWREFVRGVYWLDMPALGTDNFFDHRRPLPPWYWTGDTGMNCMREAVGQTLRTGYAHHIQRLMVTGNFALLAEIDPREVCDWYLAAYVDAVEWAELPNTAGMALFANGGRFTSKPYIASGAYIKRMSNYCTGCRYQPQLRHGENACPITVLYWHFLDKHAGWLARNPRTSLMVKARDRLPETELKAIRAQARRILENSGQL